MNSIKQKYKT